MSPVPWTRSPFPDNIRLDAAGLVAIADLSTIALRTALSGNAAYLDTLVICPGLHRQQASPDLNLGEYPVCGALTTGYVFRVENQATVVFLQRMGRTGSLTTLMVRRWNDSATSWLKCLSSLYSYQNASAGSALAYFAAVALTITAFILLGLARDYWGLVVLSLLMFARLLNVWVIRQRAKTGWHGEPEPEVKGDLLVLLSQDRWVRLRGDVDDLKAVTSGQWLKDQTFFQSSVSAVATVIVYANAALASNVRDAGKLILFLLLIGSAGLLAVANEWTYKLVMHGCTVEMDGKREVFGRRLKLVEKLLKEEGRNDDGMRQAMAQMGMTVPTKGDGDGGGKVSRKVTM